MSGLIDYAGLFPPAKLSMGDCAANYAQYLEGADSWMLGRFVVPVSRLEEFRVAAIPRLPRAGGADPWPLSALIDGDLEENLDAVFAFNHEHSTPKNGLAIIDAVEIKVPTSEDGGLTRASAEFIDGALDTLPEGLYPFFELSASADVRGCVAALAGADAGAKIRTGGVSADAIPQAHAVAEFLIACAAAEVPFKATAGLHHAVRGEQALTYESGSPRAVMHGFLNVFIGAAFVLAHRVDAAQATRVLEETDPTSFTFSDGAVSWRGRSLDISQLERTREQFALSFGSCSFEEPATELRRLGAI